MLMQVEVDQALVALKVGIHHHVMLQAAHQVIFLRVLQFWVLVDQVVNVNWAPPGGGPGGFLDGFPGGLPGQDLEGMSLH